MSNTNIEEVSFLSTLALNVEKYPKLIAVSEHNGKQLSYEELWRQALNVSYILNKEGCKKNQLVAIQIRKSCDFVVAIIGTWLARCSFMILDPDQPESRLEFMCEEAQPHYLLFGVENGPVRCAAFCICINDLDDKPKINDHNSSSADFRNKIVNDDQAYLLFTSGSSGQPKGVRVAHRGIFNVIQEQIEEFKLLSGNKSLWLHSIAFDASISDIGTALLSASELCIIPSYTPKSTRELLDYIKQLQIDFLDIPPALLQWMKPESCPDCLKTIVVGGEVCSVETLKNWANYKRVIVVYGPTEATICTSMIVVDSKNWSNNGIGYPLKNVEYSIKSTLGGPHNEGELLIGGGGVALGYLNRRELEASKFIVHEGKRFYQTGDLVRKNSDLSFEFLGRTDRQIKINGKLVAPEEVESCLLSHPWIKNVAVVPWEKGEIKSLIAYCETHDDISTKDKQELEPALRSFLKQKLPSWMVPAKICQLETLPFNQNQKVDISVLESLSEKNKHDVKKFNEYNWSSKIYNIFSKVLEQSSIDMNADCFELGVDSMSVVAILSMAEYQGIPLTAELLYRYKSINNIVEQLMANSENSYSQSSNRLTVEANKELSKIDTTNLNKNELTQGNHNILLTGATGFYGAYILWELLRNTQSTIHCLIRGEYSIARERLITAMIQHGFCIDKSDWKRINLFSGDLVKHNFGLSNAQWKALTNTVDTIYHCAANISILKPYEDLKSTNVEGTRRAIEFATQGKKKALHYVSTLSVFVDTTPKPLVCRESDMLLEPVDVYGGYAQSKWVAEKMLHLFSKQIHKLSIYRLGLLTGNLKNCKAPPQDWFSLILRGGAIPEEANSGEQFFDFTPVDYAAKALVYISLAKTKGIETFHIANTTPVSASLLAEVMNDNSARGIKSTAVEISLDLNLNIDNKENNTHNPRRLFKRSGTKFEMNNATKVLALSNIEVPIIDFDYIKEYRRKLLETG
ncbi:MAG: thioester reductase domain-containing protein [Kangiellaceae bacterium]|nr:thioester reductase domain-containing protein [Kangiellaceae bacterium]